MGRLLVGTPLCFLWDRRKWCCRRRKVLTALTDQNKPGEIWAIALSADGQYLASTSINGKINVWSLNKEEGMPRIREYETKGSFGLSVDLVRSPPSPIPSHIPLTNTSRVATARTPLPATKMALSMSSTTRPDASRTPSPASSTPSAPYPSPPPQNY